MPVQMTMARFEELVSEALDAVPPRFAEAMDNVVVLAEERNDEEPDILGLYRGIIQTRLRAAFRLVSLPVQLDREP